MTLVWKRFAESMGQLGRVVYEMLREIFDESAYERFLAAHGLRSSRKAYALYLRESSETRERRPRCC